MAARFAKLLAESETLEYAMLQIVTMMNEEEKKVFGLDGEWIAKMEELIELGSGYEMYKRLGDVLDEVRAV